MKILHVIDSGGLYGAEIMLLNLLEEQKKNGLMPILCSVGLKNDMEKPIESECMRREIAVQKFRMSHQYNLTDVFKILKFASIHKVNIIHSHGYKCDILLGFVPKKVRNIPIVSTLHGWTTSKVLSRMKIYELLHKFCLYNIDAVVSVNHNYSSRICCFKKRHFVIENGIKEIYFDKRIVQMDSEFIEFCTDSFIVGSIGRLSAEKGFDVLIRCLAVLKKRINKIKLVIIGEGNERRKLINIAHRNKIENILFMPGYRDNAYQYLPFFDIFVLPSKTEGLPITLLEAMQAGLPCVASRVGGIPKVLGYGQFGRLVEPGNEDSLCKTILELYHRKGLRQRLGIVAQKQSLAKYSVGQMEQSYLDLYRKIHEGSFN